MHKGVHVACFYCNLSNSGESGVGVFLLVFFTFVLEFVFGDIQSFGTSSKTLYLTQTSIFSFTLLSERKQQVKESEGKSNDTKVL